MNFIYILLFLILNFLIFLILKKREKKILIYFIIYTSMFLSFHFFFLKEITIDNDTFWDLFLFSCAILIFYLGTEFFFIILKKKLKFNNEFVEKGFKFIRDYILPVFVTLSQVIFLISK